MVLKCTSINYNIISIVIVKVILIRIKLHTYYSYDLWKRNSQNIYLNTN